MMKETIRWEGDIAHVTLVYRDLFKIIKGQEAAKRAAEIAASGKHSILFHGPSGCGKTMLANATVRLIGPEVSYIQIDDLDLWRFGKTEYEIRQTMASRLPIATCSEFSGLSRAIIDRFDIVIRLNAVSAADLLLPPLDEGFEAVQSRVIATQAHPRAHSHGSAAMMFLHEWAEKTNATARAYESVMEVARTIATMDGRDTIERVHIAEAASYRSATQ